MEHETSEGWNVRAGQRGEQLVVVTLQPEKTGSAAYVQHPLYEDF